MTATPNQLIIPPTAVADPNAKEICRAWVADGGLHVSLLAGSWEDPASWGIMLADLAGHIANILEQSKGLDRQACLHRIKTLFDAEMASPTDQPAGKFV